MSGALATRSRTTTRRTIARPRGQRSWRRFSLDPGDRPGHCLLLATDLQRLRLPWHRPPWRPRRPAAPQPRRQLERKTPQRRRLLRRLRCPNRVPPPLRRRLPRCHRLGRPMHLRLRRRPFRAWPRRRRRRLLPAACRHPRHPHRVVDAPLDSSARSRRARCSRRQSPGMLASPRWPVGCWTRVVQRARAHAWFVRGEAMFRQRVVGWIRLCDEGWL